MGNQLNARTHRGNARGFELSTLKELAKGTKHGISLGHYLAASHAPLLEQAEAQLLSLAGAASLRLDDLVREVRKLLAEVRRLGLGFGFGLHKPVNLSLNLSLNLTLTVSLTLKITLTLTLTLTLTWRRCAGCKRRPSRTPPRRPRPRRPRRP